MAINLISITEYARRRNCHHTAVLKAIRDNRISLIDGKIDPEIANFQWEKNTRPRIPKCQPLPALTPADPARQPLPDCAITQTGYDLQLSRAKREHHEANIAEMRERQRSGELVELADVHLAYTTLAAQFRAALERIPDKIAPRLAAESDEHAIHTLLLTELDQAMLDMATTAAQLPGRLADSAKATV
jgi:hypothetical protein